MPGGSVISTSADSDLFSQKIHVIPYGFTTFQWQNVQHVQSAQNNKSHLQARGRCLSDGVRSTVNRFCRRQAVSGSNDQLSWHWPLDVALLSRGSLSRQLPLRSPSIIITSGNGCRLELPSATDDRWATYERCRGQMSSHCDGRWWFVFRCSYYMLHWIRTGCYTARSVHGFFVKSPWPKSSLAIYIGACDRMRIMATRQKVRSIYTFIHHNMLVDTEVTTNSEQWIRQQCRRITQSSSRKATRKHANRENDRGLKSQY
jgi:hypothetical protein